MTEEQIASQVNELEEDRAIGLDRQRAVTKQVESGTAINVATAELISARARFLSVCTIGGFAAIGIAIAAAVHFL